MLFQEGGAGSPSPVRYAEAGTDITGVAGFNGTTMTLDELRFVPGPTLNPGTSRVDLSRARTVTIPAFSLPDGATLSLSTLPDGAGSVVVANVESDSRIELLELGTDGGPTPTPPQTSVLRNDGVLRSGSATDRLTSANGRYSVIMQSDGNLVVYQGSRSLWSSSTGGQGTGPYRAAMQSDGNLVVYDQTNRPLWASRTAGKGASEARMQDDGNFVVYAGTQATWASNTVQR